MPIAITGRIPSIESPRIACSGVHPAFGAKTPDEKPPKSSSKQGFWSDPSLPPFVKQLIRWVVVEADTLTRPPAPPEKPPVTVAGASVKPDAFLATAPSTQLTHTVLNQSPVLENVNWYSNDMVLQEGLKRVNAQWAEPLATDFGKKLGTAETLELGNLANQNLPKLRVRDTKGRRIDAVEFHPAYHQLFNLAKTHGVHNLSWTDSRPGRHVARAAMFYMFNQLENGIACPLTMTHAGVAVLNKAPELDSKWLTGMLTNVYDERAIAPELKTGLTMGMAMTEKQGGSDVRANTTQAIPVGETGPGKEFRLFGHKWFCSAPMSDAFLTLAKTDPNDENTLTCFLVPRKLADGSNNAFFIQHLKDKLGDRSNASSEIDYVNTVAYQVGEVGRGVPTIMEMVNLTRLDCVLGSAGQMRRALSEAVHHAQYREAFGGKLIHQPAMKNVLADLALESEAATQMGLRLAELYEKGLTDDTAQQLARLATAVGKYWVCKRTPAMVNEAMEALGGNGYVEESVLPRLYRQAPVNSIWEGSGNVIALDVLRAISHPKTGEATLLAFLKETGQGLGHYETFDRAFNKLFQGIDKLKPLLKEDPKTIQFQARRLVDDMATLHQASLLIRFSPKPVAEAFVRSRLGGEYGTNFGTLPANTDFDAILKRAWPPLVAG